MPKRLAYKGVETFIERQPYILLNTIWRPFGTDDFLGRISATGMTVFFRSLPWSRGVTGVAQLLSKNQDTEITGALSNTCVF